jgi:hypothetical protein
VVERATRDSLPAAESLTPSEENPLNPPDAQANNEETEEYVFEKIVGTREAEDGTLRYRVRWYGYAREHDTWEPMEHLPISAVRRYHRRVGLPQPNEALFIRF